MEAPVSDAGTEAPTNVQGDGPPGSSDISDGPPGSIDVAPPPQPPAPTGPPDEDAERQKDAYVRSLFDAASSHDPARHAGAVELSKASGAPVDIVRDRYDEFVHSAELSKFEPRRWRAENPGLYRVLVENPHLAPVVKDKKVSWFTKTLQTIQRYGVGDNILTPLSEKLPAPLDTAVNLAGSALGVAIPLGGVAARAVAGVKPAPPTEQAAYQASPLRGWGMISDTWGRSRLNSKLATAGTMQFALDARMLAAQASGDAAAIDNARSASEEGNVGIQRIRDKLGLTPDYGQGELGQLGIDIVQGAGAQVDALIGMGGGAAAGALIAGGATAALTRSATVAGQAAKSGAQVGAKIGGFFANFNQQTGSAYLEFRETKDDQGKPVDITAAMGAAALYGLATSAVTVATVLPRLRAFGLGAVADAATDAEKSALMRQALASSINGPLFSGIGKSLAAATAVAGAEGGVQSWLKDIANWGARSSTAGSPQSFDFAAAKENATEQAYQYALGNLAGLGGLEIAGSLAGDAIRREISRRNAARVAAVTELAGGDAASAAPKLLADIVAKETERTGQKVTSLYVDPVRLTEEIQRSGIDHEQAARELLGENGPQRIRDALLEAQETPGNRATLDVPVSEFIERWGNHEITKAVRDDIAASPGDLTARELSEVAGGEVAPKESTPTEPASLPFLRQAFESASPEDQVRAYHTDPNTGLLNLRGMEAAPRDPARPHLAEFDLDGSKFLNDRHGHEALDGAYRAMAQALSAAGVKDGGKVGGSIRAWVKDDAQARAIATAMQEAIDHRLKVTTAGAPSAGTVQETIQASSAAHKALKSELGAKGELGHRQGAPEAFATIGDSHYDSTAPIVMEHAATELAPTVERLKTVQPVTDTQLSSQHAEAIARDTAAFDTVHREASGLLSDDGWRQARELNPKPFVASADLRAFREMDKEFGRKETDAINRYFGEAISEVGGGAFDAAHPHGDEYAAQGDNEEELRAFFGSIEDVANKMAFWLKRPDGSLVVQEGLSFAHGIGETFDQADRFALPEAKRAQGPGTKPRVIAGADVEHELAALRARGFDTIGVQGLIQEAVPRSEGGQGNGAEVRSQEVATPGQAAVRRVAVEMGAAKPLYRTPHEAGMTADEFARYLKDREASTSRAALRVERHIAESKAERATAAWAVEVERHGEEAAREFDRRPDFRAQRYLKRGEFVPEGMGDNFRAINIQDLGKLDRDSVYALIGKEAAKKQLRGRLVEFGEDPSEVALRFGFKSPESMLDAITKVPDREATIRARSEEMALETHPLLKADAERLTKLAADALHNEGTSEWLIDEWKALKRRTASVFNPETNTEQSIPAKRLTPSAAAEQIPLEGIKKAARDLVTQKTVGRIDVGQTLNRERAAAEHAALAAAKGDLQQALVFKQQQLLAHFQYRELARAAEDRDKFVALAQKLADRGRREVLGKAGALYLDVVDQVLEGLGFKERAAGHRQITELVGQLEAQGMADVFPADLVQKIAGGGVDGWRGLTVDEMRDARRGLAFLYAAARDRNSLVVDGRRLAVSEVAATIAKEAEHLSDKGKLPASNTAKLPRDHPEKVQAGKLKIQALMAEHIDPEEMFKDLGPEAHRVLWDEGYIKARSAEDGLAGKVLQYVIDAQEKMPKELRRNLNNLMTDLDGVEMPPDLNLDSSSRDRAWMLMVALNMGNRSNIDRLVGGFSWDETRVRDWLNRNMTKAEWGFVQSMWDLHDKELYPHVARAYEDATGLPPQKLEAVPIETPHGTFTGGYWPAKYDPRVSRTGQMQAIDQAIAPYGGARESVMKGFTKERTKNFADVINLQWGQVASHVGQVIHYVAFDKFVRDAASLLSFSGDRGPDAGAAPVDSMQTTIQRRLGAKYETQIHGWLRVVANGPAQPVSAEVRQSAGMMRWLHTRAVQNTLAYSVTAAAAHITAPFTALARGDIGVDPRVLAPVLAQTLSPAHYGDIRAFALEHSAELRHVSDDARRTMLRNLSDAGKGASAFSDSAPVRIYEAAQDAAHFFIDKVVHLTSTMIWTAAYRQEIARGSDEKAAALRADSAVRGSIATTTPAEQPAFLRDKAGIGALIAFYGPGSKLYNAHRAIWHEWVNAIEKAEGWGDKLKVLPSAAGVVGKSLALVVFGQIMGDFLAGRGPEKDEDLPEWLMRKAIASPGHMLPPFGELTELAGGSASSYAFHGEVKSRQPSVSGAPALAAVERFVKNIGTAANENKDDDKRIWAMLEMVGLVSGAGLLSSQVSKTGSYLAGDAADDLADGNWTALMSGMIYGKRSNQGADPFSTIGAAIGD